jgi:glycosyltransferase A (GT-A) superfamily protein (DUF2064 family)
VMLRILTPGSESHADRQSRAGVCALTVMAKAPRPGTVKTRLSPPLLPAQAAALNVCFLRDTTENLAMVAAGKGISGGAAGLVSYTPIGDESLFEGLLPTGFGLVAQRGDRFGERLLAAAEDILVCGYNSVCLIDSDSPTVPTSAYQTAISELAREGDRIVLGPAAAVFVDISWSTDRVADETRARAQAAGIEVVELPLWYDVDDAATLAILRAELLAGIAPGFATLPGYEAPHTRQFLLTRDLDPDPATAAEVLESTTAEARNEESWEDPS